jgi:hypothetical protein
MVDPSLLLSDDGLNWLSQDPELSQSIVVSQVVADWMADTRQVDASDVLSAEEMLSPDDIPGFEALRTRAFDFVTGLPTFSHRGVPLDHPSHEAVRSALVSLQSPLAELHADEWVFLQTQSTLLSKVRRPVDAFRDAGAVVVEVGRKAAVQLVRHVIAKDHLPEALTRKIVSRAAAKWIVLGGATVGGGTLGGVAGTAIGGPIGAALVAKVGGFAAGNAARAALLAIDP